MTTTRPRRPTGSRRPSASDDPRPDPDADRDPDPTTDLDRPVAALRVALRDLTNYSRHLGPVPLRPYQLEAGEAIRRAVQARQGGTFSVLMSRQAGKNELSAQLEAYLLTLHRARGGSIVKCAPTFRPQGQVSLQRLERALDSPLVEIAPFDSEHGYILRLGQARCVFLSADPGANVVGATASLLLEVDEAQDVDPDRFDRDFAPMAAATNAPRVFYGTGGQADDLLQRVKRANLRLERRDGVRRHFEVPWWVVAEHNPDYGRFVEGERERLGASHPLFLSQYELKAVAPRDALLEPPQLRLLQGDHPRRFVPDPDRTYAAGVDVAGPFERSPDPSAPTRRADRDSTVIAIAEVDRSTCLVRPAAPGLPAAVGGPTARVVELVEWRGKSHQAQYHDLLELLDTTWRCRAIAVDATGLGAAPADFLTRALGTRVHPVVFTPQRKSELGYALLAAANAGRLRLYAAGPDDAEARTCWAQLKSVRRAIQPGGLLAWSAQRGHDDYVSAVALALEAATRAPPPHTAAIIVHPERYPDQGRY